ncbi:MAG TPA: DinB family protein [Puia sp.]|jgi:uncharacterized damage-inducible protein DinB|nr:DinB family protein [Puia sp.]
MIHILQKQYVLLRHSRKVLFDFLDTTVGEADLNRPVEAYMGKSVRDLLVHSASCYFHWLAYLALQQPRGSLSEDGSTLAELRAVYDQVDVTMGLFLRHFAGNMDVSFIGVHDDGWQVVVTPLELFTHVTTHEYHHKGQIVLMARILGHVPPDTDASEAFETKEPA